MIYKRGTFYWYKFTWYGKVVRESTKQTNDKVARQIEAAHRTRLARGEVGIRERKSAPTLRESSEKRFEPWAKATFETTIPNNWYWFRSGIRRLTAFDGLAKLPVDEITNEKVAGYAASERTRVQQCGEEKKQGLAASSINASIRVLRRVLNVAVEWGVMQKAPKIQLLSRMSIPAGGHKNGHRAENRKLGTRQESGQVIEGIGKEWCARRDSNSRPNAPEAFALSS
jgi:Phage integrase SAM-like domain